MQFCFVYYLLELIKPVALLSLFTLFVFRVCLLLIDPIVFVLFSRACGTPSRLTMIYCQMRKGSVLSAGPPVTCLPSPVPVAPTSWSVSITSRTSALALLEATRSSVFAKA